MKTSVPTSQINILRAARSNIKNVDSWIVPPTSSTIFQMSNFHLKKHVPIKSSGPAQFIFQSTPYKGSCLNLTSLFKLDATRKMQYRLFYLKQISYSVQVKTMSLPRTLKPETFFNVQALLLILTRIAWTYSKRTAKKNKYQPKNNNS